MPVGAALVADGRLLGVGHNRRVQQGSVIRHGETDCLENVGRLHASVYHRATMVHDAVALRHVHRRDPAVRDPARRHRREPRRSSAARTYLRSRGVEVVNLDSDECYAAHADVHRALSRRSGTRTSARSERTAAGDRGRSVRGSRLSPPSRAPPGSAIRPLGRATSGRPCPRRAAAPRRARPRSRSG